MMNKTLRDVARETTILKVIRNILFLETFVTPRAYNPDVTWRTTLQKAL